MALSARAAEIVKAMGGLGLPEAGAYLESSCAGAPELRREVEEHLRAVALSITMAREPGGSPAPRAPLGPGSEVGGYRIEGIQGMGGFGVVYRARTSGGELVALKTVRAAHSGVLSGIRREIQALSRLRHPGIVPVLGHGVLDGLPWYAMPLLHGAPFARGPRPSVVQGRRRLDAGELAGALTLARRLCTPLGYLHGEGLVHRDLKPDNVLVVDGFPVILDFGLTSAASREESRAALEQAGFTVGTIYYMSPEQGRGELVDARSDLYSVGCMLYELLAGRPPFFGSGADVLAAHQGAEPEPPSTHADGIPLDVDFLVLRLLAKEPRQRLGFAVDIARHLELLGASPGERGSPGRTYLYRPALVGRSEEVGRGAGMVRALRRGRGGLVLIRGESGIGKTRLATELARLATQGGVTVMTAACEAGSAPPLHAFASLLETVGDRCRDRGPLEAERLLGSRRATLAPFLPSGAGLPGAGEPPALPAKEARGRILGDLRATLLALADACPFVLLVDDLQWADELSLEALALLAGQLRSARALVVATVRSGEEPAPLLDLLGREDVTVVELGRLDRDGVLRMAGEMLAIDAPPPALADVLVRHAGGNPLFVAEYLRDAAERELLERDEIGVWRAGATLGAEGLPIPRSVEHLLAHRLESMSAPARTLAAVAATLGDEMAPELLARTAELAEEAQLDALQELVRRDVLEDAGEALRFTHGRLREVAYASMPGDAARAAHLAAARAIEALHPSELATHAAELARHWEQGGDRARARAWHLEAARAAAKKSAHEAELRHRRAYLALSDVLDADRVAERSAMAQGPLNRLGRYAEASEELLLALTEARSLGERVLERQALIARGYYLAVQRRSGDARPVLEEAIALCEADGDVAGAARALGYLGALGFQEGGSETALAQLEESVARFRSCGDLRGQAMSLSNLAMLYRLRGRLADGMRALEESIALSRRLDSSYALCSSLNNLGVLLLDEGRQDEATERFEECLAIARRLHVLDQLVMTLENLSSVRKRQGLFTDARRLLEEAHEVARLGESRRKRASVAMALAGIDAATGDLDAAAATLGSAIAAVRVRGSEALLADALAELGNLEILRSGPDGPAEALLEESLRLATTAQHPRGVGLVHVHRGRLALCRDEPARLHAERAREVATRDRAGPELEEQVELLEADIARRERGEALIRGFPSSSFTEAQIAWLRANRPEAFAELRP